MSSAPSRNCARTESCVQSTATGSMPPDCDDKHVRRVAMFYRRLFNNNYRRLMGLGRGMHSSECPFSVTCDLLLPSTAIMSHRTGFM